MQGVDLGCGKPGKRKEEAQPGAIQQSPERVASA